MNGLKNLSEEEQRIELECQEKIREKRKHDIEAALTKFGWLYSFMNEATHGRMDEYMEVARLVNKMINHPSKYW